MNSEAAFAALCALSPVAASSGRIVRHRLNRGGNRQANNALWPIATNRMRTDAATKEHVTRREAEGKTHTEIIRCLKRHIAREIYHLLTDPPPTPHGTDLRHRRTQARITLTARRPPPQHTTHRPITTRTRPPPQPPPRYPIPTLAHPTTDLQNIGASWVGWGEILGMGVRPRWNR